MREYTHGSPIGSDLCYCGDFRSQHKQTSVGKFLCFCGCTEFRFSACASGADLETWHRHHARQRSTQKRKRQRSRRNEG